MTSDPNNTNRPQTPASQYELKVSAYDQVASLLVALLVLVGIIVAGLVIILYTSRIFARQEAIPVTLEPLASRGENSLGVARDLEPLGVEDVPELAEPQLQDALTAVADAVADSQARLDDQRFDGAPQSSRGSGKGDSRQAGHGAEGIEEKVPRAQRWEIRFHSGSIPQYARQLDFFGIELATLGSDGAVHYAYHLSQPKPDRRTRSPELEDRLYMTWRGGPLEAADRELLGRAGIETQGRILLQFYPPQTEALLAQQEKIFAGERDVNEIRKTIFGVRRSGGAFEFYVLDQRYF